MFQKDRMKRIMVAAAAGVIMLHTSFVSMAAGLSAAMPKTVQVKRGQAVSDNGIAASISGVSEAIALQKENIRKKEEEEARIRAEEEAQRQAAYAADKELLAALIHCEAGGEPYEGQVAVGAVVMNRVQSGEFPDTIREVVYQSGQFGPAMTGKLDRILASGNIYESCHQAADAALAGQNPVGDALYFGDGRNYGTLIGGHWFHP